MTEENKIKTINDKILDLSQKNKINQNDLILKNNERLTDLISSIKDEDVKFNFFADIILLDINFDKNDILNILKTNNKNIISSFLENIDVNKKEEIIKDVIMCSLSEDVNNEVFSQTTKKFMNNIINNSNNIIIDHINSTEYINEKSNDKFFMLLLLYNRAEKKEKDIFETILSISMAEKANSKLYKMLLSSKVNMHKTNENNENGLFYINGKDEKTINEKRILLLESGIDKSLKNNIGMDYLEFNKNIKNIDSKIDIKNKNVRII